MAISPTSEPVQQQTQVIAEEIFARVSLREQKLSRLLVFYISGGLLFMILPGTFLGVWNLISISGRRAAEGISPSWIQAHGHAQMLGWIGTFILGIGYYSIPKLRRGSQSFAVGSAWFAGTLWMTGVLLRWFANVYSWQWRVLLPVSAALELVAFLMFFRAVSQHKPQDSGKQQLDTWIFAVIAGTMGLFATLLLNFVATLWLALRGSSPAFTQAFDQRFLILAAWGFMVPFVWGFSAKWLPIFLGIQPPKNRVLGSAVVVHFLAVVLGLAGFFRVTTVLFVISSSLVIVALRLFARPEKGAKTKGIHRSFPFFVRSAYMWLLIATALGIWAANAPNPAGIWGASRHALTVGFIAMMVFCVGQRVLPAFSGMRLLFSPGLMFVGLLLLTVGCIMRVSGEVLAYQEILSTAWVWLPYSAILELFAVAVFATNVFLTFMRDPVTPQSTIAQFRSQRSFAENTRGRW
jgi:uncharacterized protein involved in response to NO